ncbi:MAG: hypothetical protein A3J74_07675 [Elusimicrobia bacterium RIFCSPHIGHO2_02_FULL_57_9]|nr:MAG: hypothetical protein A3J74_07675 [Elusimicrobia bacterium RIFCSPHIGHO2_02_FULL_57_9]
MLAGAASGAALFFCDDSAQAQAIAIGLGVSWLTASSSAAALVMALAVSSQAFWWAFGGGLAFRLLVLAGLMGYGAYRPQLSQPALLLAYALGVLGFLLIEYRFLRPA